MALDLYPFEAISLRVREMLNVLNDPFLPDLNKPEVLSSESHDARAPIPESLERSLDVICVV